MKNIFLASLMVFFMLFATAVLLKPQQGPNVLGTGPVPGADDNSNYGPIHILPALLKTYTDQDLPKAGGAPGAGTAGGVGGTPGTGPGSGQLAQVASFAQQINAQLTRACIGYNGHVDEANGNYNRLSIPISNSSGYSTSVYPSDDCSTPGNRMWCSQLVIESYHLAGYGDFPNYAYVPTLRQWWEQNPSGYYFIPYS